VLRALADKVIEYARSSANLVALVIQPKVDQHKRLFQKPIIDMAI
jgi:hypothetical protein